nr:hypothetical protein GCM10020093_029980 [Planobispora longispora]
MARRALLSALAGAALGAVAARAAYAAFTRRPPVGDAETWSRTNHRGEPITLIEGPALVAGAAAAVAAAPGPPGRARPPCWPWRAAGPSAPTTTCTA